VLGAVWSCWGLVLDNQELDRHELLRPLVLDQRHCHVRAAIVSNRLRVALRLVLLRRLLGLRDRRVARSFDAPIKVLFPKDFLENGIYAAELAMLGLGDIVLPGIVVALLLRFDIHNGRTSKPYFWYFWATYIAYILGLLFTIVVMHTFKSAQPALLYLVPAVLLTPIMVAVVRGELLTAGGLFAYDEEAIMEKEKEAEESKKGN